jgi:DNA-directed RNA polymerase subunit RPC12/RpoP
MRVALRPCKECSKEISTAAPACPHCGVPDPMGFYGRCLGCGQEITLLTRAAPCPLCGVKDPLTPYHVLKARQEGRTVPVVPTQTPGEKPRETSGVVKAAALAAGLLILVMGFDALSSTGPSNTGTRSGAGTDELPARVTFNGTTFTIQNRGGYDWTDCKMDVNGGLVRSGFVLEARRIEANSTYSVGALRFADRRGSRLNPLTHKVMNMNIRCRTPRGVSSFYGDWN